MKFSGISSSSQFFLNFPVSCYFKEIKKCGIPDFSLIVQSVAILLVDTVPRKVSIRVYELANEILDAPDYNIWLSDIRCTS